MNSFDGNGVSGKRVLGSLAVGGLVVVCVYVNQSMLILWSRKCPELVLVCAEIGDFGGRSPTKKKGA
jgi:hypothetical protein